MKSTPLCSNAIFVCLSCLIYTHSTPHIPSPARNGTTSAAAPLNDAGTVAAPRRTRICPVAAGTP